jgi:hypothetical protein
MPFDVINTGTTANDGTGDPLRTAFTKVNDNTAKTVEAPTGAVTADTVVLFDGTTGKLVKGGGKVNADLVVGPASATSGRVAVYNGTTGKLLQDGAKLEADLVVGPALATADAVALYDGTTGKLLKEITKANLAADSAFTSAFVPIGAVPTGGTTGQVLTKASGTNYDTAFTRIYFPASGTVAGRYEYPPGTNSALTMTADRLYLVAMFFIKPTTVDRIGVHVTTAGAAGSVIRLGIYNADDNMFPSTLLLDAGTVVGTSTGNVDITISQALNPGIYWMCAASQGSPATHPSIAGRTGNVAPVFSDAGSHNPSQVSQGGLNVSSISGALPSTLSSVLPSANVNRPAVFVRMA